MKVSKSFVEQARVCSARTLSASMEAKSIALRNSLKCLDDIEKGISGDVVDGSQLLASKLYVNDNQLNDLI